MVTVSVIVLYCVSMVTEEENEKHDELGHWRNERYVAISLLPLIPAAILYPNVYADMALCTAMVLHSHWYVMSYSGP